MSVHAERGISAPPEVVFNTATDPARTTWLPEALRLEPARPTTSGDDLSAEWHSRSVPEGSARLRVEPADAGGARVRLDLTGGLDDPAEAGSDRGGHSDDQRTLAELARDSLDDLAGQVVDNLNAG